MKKSLAFIFCFLLFYPHILRSQDSIPVLKRPKNQVYVSAGAPAIFAGFTYERLVYESGKLGIYPRAGIGLNIFRPSFGKEFDIHTGVTFLYGNKSDIETGLGLIHYFMNQTDITNGASHPQYKLGFYSLTGCRYRFTKIPLSIKIAFVPLCFLNKDRITIFPMAEIGAGIYFRK
jgi:hypothetical protein